MADTVGKADIRGIHISKLVKGFADENSILRPLVANTKTGAREIRWYQKTAGFLDSTDSTGITQTKITPVPSRALPVVVGQTWTRNTSYAKKFFVESDLISIEDMKDNDVNAFATTMRDLVRAVNNQIDISVYSTLIEAAAATPTTPNPTDTLTTAATADGWDDAVTGDPILDILTGNQKIRAQSYETNSIVLYINPIEEKNLMQFLISTKGSSIPQFASEKVVSGQVMALLNNRVIVSQNATTDNALQFIPGVSAEWKSFGDITSEVIKDPGIGNTIRVWAWGVGLLTDPKSVHQITNTAV